MASGILGGFTDSEISIKKVSGGLRSFKCVSRSFMAFERRFTVFKASQDSIMCIRQFQRGFRRHHRPSGELQGAFRGSFKNVSSHIRRFRTFEGGFGWVSQALK